MDFLSLDSVQDYLPLPQPKGLSSLKDNPPSKVTLILPLCFPFHLPLELIIASSQVLGYCDTFLGAQTGFWLALVDI